jgi:hypothetical protein
MHREYERAIHGSERKGRSPLGWLFGAVGVFLVLGVGGSMLANARADHRRQQRLDRVVERAARTEAATPEQAAARLVERLQSNQELLDLGPNDGIRFLRQFRSADPSEDFVKTLVDARGSVPPQDDASSQSDGASLVFGTDEGRVSLDLRRTDRGGTLSIQSPDGNARIDLVRTDDGGYLTIDSDDGGVRFDLTHGEEGGRLEVRTDDGETLRLGFGDNARRTPSWVPLMDGFPEPPRPVYSLDGDAGELGAVAWQGDATIGEVLSFYEDRLGADGYVIAEESRNSSRDYDQGTLWARNEASGRVVFVVAHRTDDGTKVLVGYGERTP